MAERKPRAKQLKSPKATNAGWFLPEWMQANEKIQADLQKELGWSLGKMNEVYNGQPYRQALVEELATWLNIRPYELLMHPDEAMSLRRLRQTALEIVQDTPPPDGPVESVVPKDTRRRSAG